MTKVYVAIYEHKHGSDIRVFTTQRLAFVWRQNIALEWWDFFLSASVAPKTEDIGLEYFDLVAEAGHREWFNVEEKEIETSV